MKLSLQELWEKEKEWDKRLSSEEIAKRKEIMTDWNGISSIHLPRFVGNGSSQLLCFCDSSSKAYATDIYLRTIKDDKITFGLGFSKARNALKKKLTIPRLELMSVLTRARSLRFMAKVMRSVFVRNRVTEIINEIDVAFRYINTKHNPADIPTRGMSAKELKNNKLWWYGPEWLLQDPNENTMEHKCSSSKL